jgi:hypothetical protein
LQIVFIILRAHAAFLRHLPALWRQRKQIRATARVTPRIFSQLLRSHAISPRKVAEL